MDFGDRLISLALGVGECAAEGSDPQNAAAVGERQAVGVESGAGVKDFDVGELGGVRNLTRRHFHSLETNRTSRRG